MIGWRAVRVACAAGGACLGLAGCTIEDDVVREIGTAVPQLADSDLQTQQITTDPTQHTIQVAEWTVEHADLDLDGVVTDVTFGEPCSYTDTALAAPRGTGACAGGIVVGSGDDVRPISLALTFTLSVRRAQPLDLPAGGDFDGDGVLNAGDNCPLIDNKDQIASGGAGFGDTCAVQDSFTGATLLDNDADGISDSLDNCPQIPNPDQKDTQGVGAMGIPDGIGDACVEQVAEVLFGGATQIQLILGPDDLLQPQFRTTFLTVDLNSGTGLDCDWNAGICQLDAAAIAFCPQLSSIGACF